MCGVWCVDVRCARREKRDVKDETGKRFRAQLNVLEIQLPELAKPVTGHNVFGELSVARLQ